MSSAQQQDAAGGHGPSNHGTPSMGGHPWGKVRQHPFGTSDTSPAVCPLAICYGKPACCVRTIEQLAELLQQTLKVCKTATTSGSLSADSTAAEAAM